MKSLFLTLLCCLAVSPLMAATARSYDDALSKAGDKRAVVLFCYGANYDKVSEKAYEEMVKKRGIMPAVRSSIFLEVPVYQLPDEKQKKEYARIMGGKSLPGGIWSYPCLAVLDGKGNLRGVVQSAADMKDADTASAALLALLENFEAQNKLVDKAMSAGPKKQGPLLAQAADINVNLPGEQIKGAEGVEAMLKFDALAVVEKLQTMTGEQAHAYIRNMMANGCYSRRQRQEMMAAYAGHMRRKGASPARLRSLYYEMRNIDPNSMYAAYAEGAIELWANPGTPEPEQKPAPAPSDKTALGNTSAGES